MPVWHIRPDVIELVVFVGLLLGSGVLAAVIVVATSVALPSRVTFGVDLDTLHVVLLVVIWILIARFVMGLQDLHAPPTLLEIAVVAFVVVIAVLPVGVSGFVTRWMPCDRTPASSSTFTASRRPSPGSS